jgi:hypothetical protein
MKQLDTLAWSDRMVDDLPAYNREIATCGSEEDSRTGERSQILDLIATPYALMIAIKFLRYNLSPEATVPRDVEQRDTRVP